MIFKAHPHFSVLLWATCSKAKERVCQRRKNMNNCFALPGTKVFLGDGWWVQKSGKVQANQNGLVTFYQSVQWECTHPQSLRLCFCHSEAVSPAPSCF